MRQYLCTCFAILLLITALLIFGCGGEDVQAPDTTPPEILSTMPPNGSEGMPATSPIIAMFSEKMDPASVDTSTFHLYECCPPDCVGVYGDKDNSLFVSDIDFDPRDFASFEVPCSVACYGAQAVLLPDNILEYQTWYTALIADDVQDLAGNKMQDDHLWFFKTGSRDALPLTGVKIVIEHLEDVYQGVDTHVDITLQNDSSDVELGGFDLLIAYDASILTFKGYGYGYPIAGWEYFTHRIGPEGDCHGPCPSGMLRLVGIADINDGDNHPAPSHTMFPMGTKTVLTTLRFDVIEDRAYECTNVPIRFVWTDCGDNALTDLSGQNLWLWNNVYEYDSETIPPYTDVTGEELYGGHVWSECSGSNSIDFYGGGLDIICSDSIWPVYGTGDLNWNGTPYEIADAVIYTYYFIYGLYVFDINPVGQVAASETNMDGDTLTIADLVYLMRVITGDALPYANLTPYADTASITFDGNTVSSSSESEIGGAVFAFDIDGEVGTPSLEASGMRLLSDTLDNQLRVLIWSHGTSSIPAGQNYIFTVSGDLTLVEVSASDYNGNMMNVILR